jgi:hypothetical protein
MPLAMILAIPACGGTFTPDACSDGVTEEDARRAAAVVRSGFRAGFDAEYDPPVFRQCGPLVEVYYSRAPIDGQLVVGGDVSYFVSIETGTIIGSRLGM